MSVDILHFMKPNCCRKKNLAIDLTKTVDFLNVIAEKNRLKILCLLGSEERCVCDIWQYLNLPQNLTSHHLKVLKDFKLIKARKEGLRVYYSINKQELLKFNSLLNKFLNY